MGCDSSRIVLMCVVALAGCKGAVEDRPPPVGATFAGDSTLQLASAKVTFGRYAAICGIANPPFTDDDLFALNIFGAGTMPAGITISCSRSVTVDGDIAVPLTPLGIISYTIDANGNMANVEYGQHGNLAAGNLHFGWFQGSNPDEVDSQPLTSVDLRFAAFPQQDDDNVDVRIKMVFQDGGILDLDVREPLPPVTGSNGCPRPRSVWLQRR